MQVRSGVNAMRGQEIATSCLTSTVQCPYSLYNICSGENLAGNTSGKCLHFT